MTLSSSEEGHRGIKKTGASFLDALMPRCLDAYHQAPTIAQEANHADYPT
jgi:hypothetical protein